MAEGTLKNNNLTFEIFSFLLENIINVKPKSSSFINDYKKICNLLKLDFNYLINYINEIIISYKKDYFDLEGDDINYNIIKAALQSENYKDRIYFFG
jgi:hypothetical protein